MYHHRGNTQTQNITYSQREKKTRMHHHRGNPPNIKQSIAQEKKTKIHHYRGNPPNTKQSIAQERRRLQCTTTVERPKHKRNIYGKRKED
jgi:hypothetical protein